jgi:hypothetical protein
LILLHHHHESQKNWPYRFLRQTDRYIKGKRRVVDVDRQEAEDPATVMQWYNYFQLRVEIYGIHDEDIWIFDEIGFRLGQGRTETIFTQYPERNNDIASASDRTLVSSIECVMSLEILFHQYWFYQATFIWRVSLLLQNYQMTISLKYLTQDTQIKDCIQLDSSFQLLYSLKAARCLSAYSYG